jgi:type II secretory pathway pseudopilin PulG
MNNFKQTPSKQQGGFTLTELVVGIAMTMVVSTMALQALVNSQQDFSEGRTNIETGQKLSSILDIIRRDVQQAGENISEASFPVIRVTPDGASGSKVILYRALQDSLPVCTAVGANPGILAGSTVTEIVTSANNNTNFTNIYPSCLSDAGPNYPLKQVAPAGTDSWEARRTDAATPATKVVLHDGAGNIQLFDYTGNAIGTQSNNFGNSNTTSISTSSFVASRNFNLGSNIYLIEKREYIVCNSTLKVLINLPDSGAAACPTDGPDVQTIATNIEAMDITTSIRTPVPATPGNANPADLVTPGTLNGAFPDLVANQTWQNIQGIAIMLKAKDPKGRAFSTLSTQEQAKLTVEGKFYPRNILSAKRTR